VIHEIVELVRALAWPLVAFYFGSKFQGEIRSLLREMPHMVRRIRSAHGLGIEIKLDRIGGELEIAEVKAQTLSLKFPPTPGPGKPEGGD
jgi:hypothetical protein